MRLRCKMGKHNYGNGCVCQDCRTVKTVKEVFSPQEIAFLLVTVEEFIKIAKPDEQKKIENCLNTAGIFLLLDAEMTYQKAEMIVNLCRDCILDTKSEIFNKGRQVYFHINEVARQCMYSFAYENDD